MCVCMCSACLRVQIQRYQNALVGQAGACAVGSGAFLPLHGDSVFLLRPLADWMRPTQTMEGALLYLKSASFGCPCIYTTPPATPRLALWCYRAAVWSRYTETDHHTNTSRYPERLRAPTPLRLHQPHRNLVVTLLSPPLYLP